MIYETLYTHNETQSEKSIPDTYCTAKCVQYNDRLRFFFFLSADGTQLEIPSGQVAQSTEKVSNCSQLSICKSQLTLAALSLKTSQHQALLLPHYSCS